MLPHCSLCRGTPVRTVAEGYQEWTAVTGPEGMLGYPAMGQEVPALLDAL